MTSKKELNRALFNLTRRLYYPNWAEDSIKSDYKLLMENLENISDEDRLAYINKAIQWLVTHNLKMIPKKKQYFGEDLEIAIGLPTNDIPDGDLLGLELKAMTLVSSTGKKASSALRLTTKLSSSVAKFAQEFIKTKCRKGIQNRYSKIEEILYYGDYYKYHNGSELTINQRIGEGFLLMNGEVLYNNKQNNLGRTKFVVDTSGVLRFYFKPEGYTLWRKADIEINLHEELKKFKQGFILSLSYPRDNKKKRYLLGSFHVKITPYWIIKGIREGTVGIEIRYDGGGRGKMENSGDALQLTKARWEKLVFESVLSVPLTSDYKIEKLNK